MKESGTSLSVHQDKKKSTFKSLDLTCPPCVSIVFIYFIYVAFSGCQLSMFLFTEYKEPNNFLWEKYLEETGAQAAPARAFKPVPVHSHTIIYKTVSKTG